MYLMKELFFIYRYYKIFFMVYWLEIENVIKMKRIVFKNVFLLYYLLIVLL